MKKKLYYTPYVEVMESIPEALLTTASQTEQDGEADAKQSSIFEEADDNNSVWEESPGESSVNIWGDSNED